MKQFESQLSNQTARCFSDCAVQQRRTKHIHIRQKDFIFFESVHSQKELLPLNAKLRVCPDQTHQSVFSPCKDAFHSPSWILSAADKNVWCMNLLILKLEMSDFDGPDNRTCAGSIVSRV